MLGEIEDRLSVRVGHAQIDIGRFVSIVPGVRGDEPLESLDLHNSYDLQQVGRHICVDVRRRIATAIFPHNWIDKEV